MKLRDGERAAQAVRLRSQGRTWDEIAAECEYYDKAAAYRAAMAELRRRDGDRQEHADALLDQLLDELEAQQRAAWDVLVREHVAVSGGRVVKVERDGKEVELRDDEPTLRAIDRLTKITERKAKLLGLERSEVNIRAVLDEELGDQIAEVVIDLIAPICAVLPADIATAVREWTAEAVPVRLRQADGEQVAMPELVLPTPPTKDDRNDEAHGTHTATEPAEPRDPPEAASEPASAPEVDDMPDTAPKRQRTSRYPAGVEAAIDQRSPFGNGWR
jgi:hypothetical protein